MEVQWSPTSYGASEVVAVAQHSVGGIPRDPRPWILGPGPANLEFYQGTSRRRAPTIDRVQSLWCGAQVGGRVALAGIPDGALVVSCASTNYIAGARSHGWYCRIDAPH